MKKVLIIGAGRSSYFAIKKLNQFAGENRIELMVADASGGALLDISKKFKFLTTQLLNILDDEKRSELISRNDIVISLLPATFHSLVAKDCLQHLKHLITPSYLSNEIQVMDEDAKERNLIFLNEIGLDPGIDHMSTMKIISELREKGAIINSYQSWCGGLVAPESDNNPWHYKLSWNPYNVIRAGSDGAIFKENSSLKMIPYHRLFSELKSVEVLNGSKYDGYLNRNSLPYIKLYGLNDVDTFLRGTLRHPGFCSAWNLLVIFGITNDKIEIESDDEISLAQFFRMFIASSWPENLIPPKELEALEWLGWNSSKKIAVNGKTPANIFEKLLTEKWEMEETDKDLVVMVHEFEYNLNGGSYKLQSSLTLVGDNSHETAMAKTVGLPLAFAAILIAEERINLRGALRPTCREIYEPILSYLNEEGISFHESVIKL